MHVSTTTAGCINSNRSRPPHVEEWRHAFHRGYSDIATPLTAVRCCDTPASLQGFRLVDSDDDDANGGPTSRRLWSSTPPPDEDWQSGSTRFVTGIVLNDANLLMLMMPMASRNCANSHNCPNGRLFYTATTDLSAIFSLVKTGCHVAMTVAFILVTFMQFSYLCFIHKVSMHAVY